jgi:glycosyltransferase involved in cell wall biosynthesis
MPPAVQSQTRSRLALVIETLGGEAHDRLVSSLRQLEALLMPAQPDRFWFALAVFDASFPVTEAVVDALRVARLDGPLAALAPYIAPSFVHRLFDRRPPRKVEVITGGYLIDIEETSRSPFSTGIQRVARETAQRWAQHDDVVLVGWWLTRVGFRRLSQEQIARAWNAEPETGDPVDSVDVVVIPWHTNYLLPELSLQPLSLQRLAAFARFSGSTTGLIGFDCVPLTSAETVDFGVAGGFAGNLSATKYFDRVATISDAAAVEYRGWTKMLRGAGLEGPDVKAIPLAVEAPEPTPGDVAEAAELLGASPDLPILLCVGSHEPRKNHLALLQAAELAWRGGAKFGLAFVGGNSWRSQEFEARIVELQEIGRPIRTFTAMPDRLLWASYRAARAVAFPSLNEGFGLPIAEALALGTPVITSKFGSMAEIAASGGAILVDPRDERDISAGIVAMVDGDARYRALKAAASARPGRSWDEYAAETWRFLAAKTTAE